MTFKERMILEWSRHKGRFFFLLFITVVSAVLRTAIPYYYKLVVDGLETKMPVTEIGVFISGIVILSAARFIIYSYFQANRAMMNMRFQWTIRRRAFRNLLRTGRLTFQKMNTGEIVTRLSDDAEKLTWFLSSGVFRGLDAVLIFFFTVGMLLLMSPVLTLYTVISLMTMTIFMAIFDKTFHRAFNRLQKAISETNDYIHSTMSGISIVKSFNREEQITEYFHELVRRRKTRELKVVSLDAGLRGIYMSLHTISTVIVLLIGGLMKIQGSITLGTLVAFLALIKNLTHPVLDIGNLFVRGKSAAVSSTRISALEEMRSPEAGGTGKASFEHQIRLDDVGFTYEGHDILKEISLEIRKGEKIALMGKLGSGKSFLSLILAGIIRPTSGRMTVDGRDISCLKAEEYRLLAGYASQQPVIFTDTIRNNILMGEEPDKERLEYSLHISQLGKEMEKFGLGLETVVGPKGKTLSGGQKQRLALARALYHQPPLLVLDDITSALDAETEMHLWEDLFAGIPHQTLVLVTHRPKTAGIVDRIYLLEEGHIAESGNHEELMSRPSLYREIYHENS